MDIAAVVIHMDVSSFQSRINSLVPRLTCGHILRVTEEEPSGVSNRYSVTMNN